MLDVNVTDWLARTGKVTTGESNFLRVSMKMMEWSMHGVVWLTAIIFYLFTTKNVSAIPMLTNLLLALLFDLFIIGSVKLAFRRKRPAHNVDDMVAEAPYVDQFSFPSGHSSRGAMMTKLLLSLAPLTGTSAVLVLIYPIALAVSRVMLGRHYCSDVIVGLLIGMLEGDLAVAFWLPADVCVDLVKLFRTIPNVA